MYAIVGFLSTCFSLPLEERRKGKGCIQIAYLLNHRRKRVTSGLGTHSNTIRALRYERSARHTAHRFQRACALHSLQDLLVLLSVLLVQTPPHQPCLLPSTSATSARGIRAVKKRLSKTSPPRVSTCTFVLGNASVFVLWY